MTYYVSAALKTLSFFLILPVAAHLLPKEEVGRFFFWLAVIHLGAGITTLGFASAVARRAYNRAIANHITSLGVLVAILAWLMVSIVGVMTGLLSVAVVVAWVARSIAMLGEARTVALNRIPRLSILYILYAIAFPGLSVVFASIFDASSASLLLAFAFSEGLIACFGLEWQGVHLRKLGRQSITRMVHSSRNAVQYGLPIMIAGIANIGLNSADRFIVTGFHGFDAVAEFSIMYTIAFASNRFITAPVNLRLFPVFVRGRSDESAVKRVQSAATLGYLATIGYCASLAVIGPWVLTRVLGEAYSFKHLDLALVSAASAMFLLFTVNSVHLKVANRTGQIMYLLFGALFINLCASLLLVPKYGYHGASISTFVAYSSLAIWSLLALRPSLVNLNAIGIGTLILAGTFAWAAAR